VHLWSDRKKKVQEPLFRGYVFVKSDLRNRLSILQTDGIVRFVGVRNQPSPIPEHEVNWIRILANHPDALQREEYMSVGQTVRIIAGPFRGLEGFISRVKDASRVVVSFSSIAQSVSVEVVSQFVETVDSSSSVLVSSL
jgi:transcription antitermination factor NusG